MAIREDDGYRIREEMWDRLDQCTVRLKELENTLLKNEETRHYHAETKEKIHKAYELIDAFGDSSEDTETEKQINEMLESLEQYLKLGVIEKLVSIIQNENQGKKEFEEKVEEKIKEENVKRSGGKADEWVHILHLSDLHFGIYLDTEDDIQNEDNFKSVVERQLFPFLKDYTTNKHRIDIVAITGDISYRHKEKGYHHFKEWLQALCDEKLLNINIRDHVIMCPGNHDSIFEDRKTKGLISKGDDADKISGILTMDKIMARQDQFQYFNEICAELDMEWLTNFDVSKVGYTVPYVMGTRKIDGIHFVVLNSAWNSFPRKGNNGFDRGQLLLGNQPIKSMLEHARIPKEEMTVMLFHHPLAWLHEAETRTYGKDQSKPSASLIREHADVILNGHVHGGIEPPDILANKTVVFGGGTLYTTDSCLNQFEIISVNKTEHYCTQTVVRFDKQAEAGSSGWKMEGDGSSPRIHYGIYREIRDLVTKYSLGEISRETAAQMAFKRAADIGQQEFLRLLEKIRFQVIREMEKDERMSETVADTLEESADKTKALTKDGGDGEKQP